MSGQHCENYDVKRETVHCNLRNVERCCTWSERAVEGGLMLSQESQRVFQSLLLFFLFCYITNHLRAGPLGSSEFCFPRISLFPSSSSRETLRFSGNKIHCSPRDQSLSVYYSLTSVSLHGHDSPLLHYIMERFEWIFYFVLYYYICHRICFSLCHEILAKLTAVFIPMAVPCVWK